MKHLTFLLLVITFTTNAKPLPFNFVPTIKTDAIKRTSIINEKPKLVYVFVELRTPNFLFAEDIHLTDGVPVELNSSPQLDNCMWQASFLASDVKDSLLQEITDQQIKAYCLALMSQEHLKLTDGTNNFFLSDLERKIIIMGLKMKEEDLINNDITIENKRKIYGKIQEYLNTIDFLNLTCPDDTTIGMLYGKRTFIEYMALTYDKKTFFRFFLSGFYKYNLETDKIKFGGKSEQYYMSWLNEQIEKNPDNLTTLELKSLKENRDLVYQHAPQLKNIK